MEEDDPYDFRDAVLFRVRVATNLLLPHRRGDGNIPNNLATPYDSAVRWQQTRLLPHAEKN